MTKVLDKYQVIRAISSADIQHDAIHIRSQMFVKTKLDGRVTARLAAGGNDQPNDSFVDTYAATSDDSSKLLLIAAFHADAVHNNYLDELHMSDFDVPGAFLNIKLDKVSAPRQIIMRLPPDIPHPLAGKEVEVVGGLYGLKQSNHLFEQDIHPIFLSCGFTPLPSDSKVYIKRHPTSPRLKCAISMHVDDGLGIYTHRPYYDEIIAALTNRYGPLTQNDICTSHTGISLITHPTGAVSTSMQKYITSMLHDIGMDHIPPASTPSDESLFHAPTDTTPVTQKFYQRVIGCLIHCLKIRADIRKEVTYLATRTSNPTASDLEKAIRVLRYLKHSPTRGLTFYTAEGVRLYGHVDASYGTLPDGRSQTGFYCTIGRFSAPFFTKTGAQNSCVATGSMEAEYVALNALAKRILHFRFFLADLGFEQTEPTIVLEDNQSAINLAIAPQITRKSKHIHVRHHHIRDLVAQNIISIKHLPTAEMTADLLTKPLGPTKFNFFCHRLLNSKHNLSLNHA
jgi:hypothetical protein